MADFMWPGMADTGHGGAFAQSSSSDWPELPWDEWADTGATLHLWTQIIGKIRLALATPVNHWWHTTLYVTCSGLTTSPMPYGNRFLQIDFDFLNHQLIFQASDGAQERVALRAMSVADFYRQVMETMNKLGMPICIHPMPVEIQNPIAFELDETHKTYDAPMVSRFWRILLRAETVMQQFRGRFTGKVSPVHFFWGSFDLAVTRFSGRVAPPHASVPNTPDYVVQAAYSHEVSSCGFWPGGSMFQEPIFYAYAYPAPPHFATAAIRPAEAYFNQALGEFVLPYDALRQTAQPDETLLSFFQSTYEATAQLGKWDRAALETAETSASFLQ